jgi:acetyl esterase/lipase
MLLPPPINRIEHHFILMIRTFHYGASESQVGDLYIPEGNRPAVVCLLHGGFWRMPYGREEMAAIATDLAARGYAVWNIEYRRIGSQGGGWPGTLEDTAAAIDHLAVLAAGEVELDLRRVAVVGHSAGGHLALCATARRREPDGSFAPRKVFPAAAAGLAAVLDLHASFSLGSGNNAVSALLAGSPGQHPVRYAQASPLGLVPLHVRQLILHGTKDDALPVELSRAYVKIAREVGDDVDYVELPGMGHMEYLDPASQAHDALCKWLAIVLASPSDYA